MSAPTPPTPPSSDATLSVRDLSRRFGRTWVLKRVSLDVPSGGAVLLLGNNGSGKTTLLRCVATALRPHDGSITLGGRSLWEERATLRQDVLLLSHAHGLYADLSADQNLAIWQRLLTHADQDPAAVRAQLLNRVGLEHTGDRPLRQFSAGMTRRLALATALLKRPRLVLLDEPFSALDTQGRALVHTVVRELVDAGCTLLLATHDPGLGAAVCPRAVRLAEGRIVWDGPSSQVTA